MTDPQLAKSSPSTLNRRKFLAAAGAGVAGSSLLTMLDAKQAPAQIKGTTLRILQWSHFIPAYDTWFDSKLTKEWGDKNGVKVRVDHIPHLELPARMAAEYAAGAGHDIIMNGSSILTRLYYKSLADLSDIYEAAGKKHGGWIPTAKALVVHPNTVGYRLGRIEQLTGRNLRNIDTRLELQMALTVMDVVTLAAVR